MQTIQAQPAKQPDSKHAPQNPKPPAPNQPNVDRVQFSQESQQDDDPADPGHLAGPADNFGTQNSDPIELINPSAPLEKSCGEILGALGESLPGDLDLATTAVATPVGNGVLAGRTTGSLALEGILPALQGLDAQVSQVQAEYHGNLPPKVARHVELARAAAARAGLS